MYQQKSLKNFFDSSLDANLNIWLIKLTSKTTKRASIRYKITKIICRSHKTQRIYS